MYVICRFRRRRKSKFARNKTKAAAQILQQQAAHNNCVYAARKSERARLRL
jgi:hypothetical protein